MTNDYPESYKPVEGVPPPPRRFAGSMNAAEMIERLTPANARAVLAFLDSQDCHNTLPEHLLDRLAKKAGEPDPKPSNSQERSL